jgi:hypothetical protein
MLIVPLEEPVVPPSWTAVQLLSAWILLTFTAFDGTTEVAPLLAAFAVAPAVTSIVTSVTHAAPLSPQTFTCRVCDPLGAATGPSMYVAFHDEVCVLLSSE